jgi:hypothetical protein
MTRTQQFLKLLQRRCAEHELETLNRWQVNIRLGEFGALTITETFSSATAIKVQESSAPAKQQRIET